VSGGGAAAPPKLVTVTIDGQDFPAEEGRNMLDVALSLGFDLPFFCWHPIMGSIGACRQCAVRLYWTDRDGNEKSEIAMACMTEAQEGTRIDIEDDEAIRFRAEMIELMMLSHPHDCPVCDEGGECHLQDMTVMTGHSYRRYRGRKRTFENQDLGPFVTHELNRCITCYRCARFYNDYAGGRDFGAFGLRNQVYFGRVEDGALESEFSGNLIEVCPTGVFDDKPFAARYARKWDLQTAPSVCPHCGLGCSTTPAARDGELRRVQGRFNRDVNKMFLCDRGRYGYEFVNAPQRVRAARAAGGADALGAAAGLLRDGRAIGIGSPRASLEANYALRALVGPGRFYRGLSDTDDRLVGAVLEVAADPRLRLGSLADVAAADALLLLGEDVTNTAPMLDLTIRTWLHLRPSAVEERNHIRRWNDAGLTRIKRREPSALWVATTQATKLDEVAAETHRAAPDGLVRLALAIAHEADRGAPAVKGLSAGERRLARSWAAALAAADAPLVVAGCSSGSPDLVRAAARLTLALRKGSAGAATLVLTVPEPDSVGLRLLGGGTLVQGLAAVARGEAGAVVVLDNDLDRRAPALLVDDFLRRRTPVVALAVLEDRLTAQADVVLPAAAYAEETGTFVSHEGRAQRYFSVLPPAGEARPAWRWLRDLMERLGHKEAHGWNTPDDVLAALEADLPEFRGVSAAAPPAGWRADGRKVARQPQRVSGRTALDADRTVHEPAPAPDPESALAYSLEGLTPERSPAALRARVWSPGWNSVSGLHKFEQELEAVRPAASLGIRLLDAPVHARELPPLAAPPRTVVADGEFTLVALHRIFGSDDLSMYSPAVAARAPGAFIGLNREDAARLGVREGDVLELWLPWMDARARCALVPSLPDGTAGVPVGLPGLPYISLPARARLARAGGTA
jgi:NADH-quinone oxidoreductase subunit G